MRKILLIDDDQEMCSMLQEYLEEEGFAVTFTPSGEEGLKQFGEQDFHLVILDLGLPDVSGFEVLAEIRRASSMPVLILTGRSELIDCVTGLEMGADDYNTKPFAPRELLARIRSLLRRAEWREADQDETPSTLILSDLTIDTRSRKVLLAGERVNLTSAEFDILKMLLLAKGGIVTRERLSEEALHRELTPYDRSVDVHVSRIRAKLGPRIDGEQRIVTIRGAGYVYTCSTDETLHLDLLDQSTSGSAA